MGVDGALVLEGPLPVVFRPIDGEVLAADPTRLATNLRMFQACELLDDRQAADRSETDSPVMAELKRLDLKMSLLMELLADMAGRAEHHAQQYDVALDFRGLTWSPVPAGLAVGQRGSLAVYIHPALPRPLTFIGTVTALDAVRGEARFDFDTLDDPEADQLERLIFRSHRRKVADVRGLKRKF